MYEIFKTVPVVLPSFTTTRRKPIRPPELREPGFDSRFDDTTFFYDGFRAANSRKILLIGPPLLNLAAAVRSTLIRAVPSGQPCDFRVKCLDLCVRIEVDAPPDTEGLAFESELGSFELQIGENLSHHFRGLRTLLTQSKNNAIPWILDWIRYHRDIHGAEAALIYDNASTDYDVHSLSEELRAVQGLKAAYCRMAFQVGPAGWAFPTLLGFSGGTSSFILN